MKGQVASDALAHKGADYTAFVTGIFSIITSIISVFTIAEWAAIIGILVALSGWWYRRSESKLMARKIQAEERVALANEQKLMAETIEIQKRVAFMERAGLNQVPYYQATPELAAMEGRQDEQAA